MKAQTSALALGENYVHSVQQGTRADAKGAAGCVSVHGNSRDRLSIVRCSFGRHGDAGEGAASARLSMDRMLCRPQWRRWRQRIELHNDCWRRELSRRPRSRRGRRRRNRIGQHTTFVGGGQAGCNWQKGTLVFGMEGDFDYFHSNSNFYNNTDALPVLGVPFVIGQSLVTNYLGDFGRGIGVAADRNFALHHRRRCIYQRELHGKLQRRQRAARHR